MTRGRHAKPKQPIRLTKRGEWVVSIAIVIGAWLALYAFANFMAWLNQFI